MRTKSLVAAVALAVTFTVVSTGGAAAQQGPPTLSGEAFHQHRPAITSADCTQSINFSYVATGTATGPYPGTFVERGTVGSEVHATFEIDSPVGQVTGTKAGHGGRSCVTDFTCSGETDCEHASIGYNTNPGSFDSDNRYEATISTDSGLFSDRGLWGAALVHSSNDDFYLDGFDAVFQSDLESPVQLLPTTKAQCRNGGWRNYGVFTNQGDCVSFVRHQARQACIVERLAHGVAAFRAKYGAGPYKLHAMRGCIRQRTGP